MRTCQKQRQYHEHQNASCFEQNAYQRASARQPSIIAGVTNAGSGIPNLFLSSSDPIIQNPLDNPASTTMLRTVAAKHVISHVYSHTYA